MDKPNLLSKIKQLDTLSNDEKAYLVNLVNTKKKYGLVWENKPEDVEEQLRTKLPILKEVTEKRIEAAPPQPSPTGREQEASPNPSKGGEPRKATQNPQKSLFEPENISEAVPKASPHGGGLVGASPSSSSLPLGEGRGGASGGASPNHILIEGDNLHALTALTFTHEGQIDVMYFDPPYNTGNKDFKYNDSFVDREDSYRHSKWLSFMDKRLRIAKRLLSEKGVIFISIDDYEQATLKLLCDEIFTEMNFVGNVIWQRAFSPINLKKTISQNHDFIIIYCKQDFNTLELNKLPRTENATNRYKNPDNDPRGPWTSSDLTVGPVIEEKLYKITTPSGAEYYPPKGRCWVISEIRYKELLNDNQIWFGENGSNMPRRKKFLTEVRDGVVAMSLWTHQEVGHTQDAKKELKEVLHENENPFETVKPLKLIDRIFKLTTDNKKQYKILDIFAGSGTTLHATMKLNADDGGNRQCILVTNNENNIAEEVCYERNRRVIQGYTNSKGEWVHGLTNNNLRYYKSEFVESAKTEENRRKLTLLSTELLQIKEDCYQPVAIPVIIKPQFAQAFTNGKGKYLLVVYYHRQQSETSQILTQWIKHLSDLEGKIKLYGFSPETEILANDFFEVADKIDPVPLPDAIYNAYRNTFRTLRINKRAQTRNNGSVDNSTEDNVNTENEGSVQTDLFS
jgi:adenine-specific DNA-methyltransferase